MTIESSTDGDVFLAYMEQVLCPKLLSNLYMRRFVLGWKTLGHEKRLKAYIVNYADDLVNCCRDGAEEALARMRDMMSKLKLIVNESKTRVCRLPEEKLPTKPLAGVVIHRLIGFTDRPHTEVVRPPNHHAVESLYDRLRVQKGSVSSGLVADCSTDALHPFLRWHSAQIGSPRIHRVASPGPVA
jgi:hypothetical protein